VKNEINYSPQKEPTLSAIVRRQAETEADLSIITKARSLDLRSCTGILTEFGMASNGMGDVLYFLCCVKRKTNERARSS
jgi:hypothetical protein